MNYNHLTINERACVYQFKQMGLSIREIAKALDRSPSTISRELRRNYCGCKFKYLPHIAQEKYKQRRKNCHRKELITNDVKQYIESKILIHWSPDQIIKRKEKNKPNLPSLSTIYIKMLHLI